MDGVAGNGLSCTSETPKRFLPSILLEATNSLMPKGIDLEYANHAQENRGTIVKEPYSESQRPGKSTIHNAIIIPQFLLHQGK